MLFCAVPEAFFPIHVQNRLVVKFGGCTYVLTALLVGLDVDVLVWGKMGPLARLDLHRIQSQIYPTQPTGVTKRRMEISSSWKRGLQEQDTWPTCTWHVCLSNSLAH